MSADIKIAICDSDLQLDELRDWMNDDSYAQGATVEFTGKVRVDDLSADLEAMVLEHYPGMTESQLLKILQRASSRWQLGRIAVAHRIGTLRPGDPIVYVAVNSGHRQQAFNAAEFIMDYLKNDATFWKKEIYKDHELWVEAKNSDIDALKRWQ